MAYDGAKIGGIAFPYEQIHQDTNPSPGETIIPRQLQDTTTTTYRITADPPPRSMVRDVRMINGESTAREDFDRMFVESRRRRDQSSEEKYLRRRYREAMVLNDGTQPLRRDDIIQRER
jgi:hypothetical protein